LVDSNLDWGQDLIALRDWQRTNNITDLNLAYYGTARPEAPGVSQTAAGFFAERFVLKLTVSAPRSPPDMPSSDEPATGNAVQSLVVVCPVQRSHTENE
jgi:hypothetical protein